MTIKRNWTGRLEIESHLIAAHGQLRDERSQELLELTHERLHDESLGNQMFILHPHKHMQCEST
jgi:hypothetical protein